MKPCLKQIQEKKLKNSIIFQTIKIKFIIIIVCVLANCFTLFTILKAYIAQSVTFQVIITIVISGVFNISPVLSVNFLSNKDNHSSMKKIQISSLLSIALILFVITFSLRWISREDVFASNDYKFWRSSRK